ncbi:hypothetical protein Btru_029434 [Bulinus truncatus]|nr:hypothetical protein Btru_029434 [Bulinus truncatus]
MKEEHLSGTLAKIFKKVNAAVTYSREYLRALVYLQLTMTSFRHIGALFENKQASELTACYHTELIPGHSKSDLCNMSAINGSPWFCARPIKNQLDCDKDFAGSRIIAESKIIPATPSEIELFRRSSGEESKNFRLISNNIQLDVVTDSLSNMYMSPETACNKIPISDTWNFELTSGFMYKNIWHPTYCHIPRVNRDSVYSNLEVVILGDSNGRSHYYHFLRESGCSEVRKALNNKWHKSLLCVHKKNGFTLRWEPHSQPFLNATCG